MSNPLRFLAGGTQFTSGGYVPVKHLAADAEPGATIREPPQPLYRFSTLVYGGTGLGLGLSQAVARRTGRNVQASRAAAAGTALLAGTLQLLVNVPVVGATTVALTVIVAVGAVILTGFGLRPYTPPDDMADDPAGGPWQDMR